jgi:hypothetical protein
MKSQFGIFSPTLPDSCAIRLIIITYEERAIMAVISDSYSLPLAFRPGAGWLYSNIGYYLLA